MEGGGCFICGLAASRRLDRQRKTCHLQSTSERYGSVEIKSYGVVRKEKAYKFI